MVLATSASTTFRSRKRVRGRSRSRSSSAASAGPTCTSTPRGPIFAPTADAPHPLTGEAMPITLGHEFAGVVHEVGDGVDDVHVGDRVVVEPYIICGHCDACTQGRYNVCQSVGFVGLSGFGGV